MNKIKIQWATEAREQWRKTALYIQQEWGISALRKFKENTEEIQNQLLELRIFQLILLLVAKLSVHKFKIEIML